MHLIVASAFHGPCPAGHECNHKNGKKRDNRASNLEWVTKRANRQHAWRTGLCRSADHRGRRNPNATITDADVRRIRARAFAKRESLAAIGADFGLKKSAVGKIARREAWTHVS